MGRLLRRGVVILVAVVCLAVVAQAADAAPVFDAPAHAVRELTAKRTAASRTWEMPSGERVTQLAAAPVQWKDVQGDWHMFDPALSPTAGGWSAQSGRLGVDLPERLDGSNDSVIRLSDDAGNAVGMTFLGDGSSGSASGGVVSYADVGRGVSLRLQVVPNGLKEDVVLADANASRELRYRLTVSDDDLSLEHDGLGGVRIEREGRTVFGIPAPLLIDAKGTPAAGSRFVLEREGPRSWIVSMALNERWLDSLRRAWPVVVDPTINVNNARATLDCPAALNRAYAGGVTGPFMGVCNASPVAYTGVWAGTVSDYAYRGQLLRFDALTGIQNDAIESAQLQLDQTWHDTGARALNVYAVGTYWDASTPPWVASSSWADGTPAAVIPAGADGLLTTDLTALVDEWRHWETSGGAAGRQNRGILINMQGAPIANVDCVDCDTPQTYPRGLPDSGLPASTLSTAVSPAPTPVPILQVRSWPAAAAGNAIISPGEGDLTGKRVPLQARALASSVRTVRFQYIAGSQRTWTDVPLAALKTPTRAAAVSQDVAVSGPSGDRRSDLVVWDLSAMPGGEVDGPVHVRAWLDSATAGDGGMTEEVNFRLDRRGIDGAPTEPIGPGEVNLLSGEFSMSQTDASLPAFLQDLTVTRTYRSRGVSVRNADMFGSGWDASVEADGGDLPYKGLYDYSEVRDEAVDRQVLDPASWNWELFFDTFDFEDLDADVETVQDIERFEYHYAVVEASDGTKMTFTQVTDSRGNVTDWTPDDQHPGYAIRRETTGTADIFRYTLTDPSGNTAVFLSETAKSPNARLSSFQQPGSTSALSYSYEAAGTRQRLRSVTAPTPSGGTTRSLVFAWSSVGSTATADRVTRVDFQLGTNTPIPLETYSYDANARLIQATDARVAGSVRFTRYHYNAGGQLDQVTPSGLYPWNLAYTTISGDGGPRLSSVSRADPVSGTATNTVLYDVPLSGAGAPYDMSTSATAAWGQTDDIPWDAVAIFPADTVPDPRSPNYARATIHYLDVQGLEVNVALPGGAISTAWHDANGNVIRALSAQGRADALAAGASSASVAADRSTLAQYASNGVDLLATREPVTQITLSDGRAVTGRRVRSTHFDENAPAGGPYHLPTSEWRAVEPTSGGQVDMRETVRYDYSTNGGGSGWSARHATKTIVDPAGRAETSYSILHPSYPIVEETVTPGARPGDVSPDVQYYQYYAVSPSSTVPTGILDISTPCGSAAKAGMLCERSEGTTPTASVPRRWYTYTTTGQVQSVVEGKELGQAGTIRTTTYGYDGADQLTSKTITGGSGNPTPTVTYAYQAATGLQTQATSSNGTVNRGYDSIGRRVSYTDAAGSVSRFRYDLRGRVVSSTVYGTTSSYGYDDRDNVTSISDPGLPAAIRGTYDLDDNVVAETLPNGLVAMQTNDAAGDPLLLSWTQTSGCSSNCVWARSEILGRDADGRIVSQRTNGTQETLAYDTVGRLSQDDAVRLSDNRCVRRTYAYDAGATGDSNRTSASVWTSSPGAACGAGSPTTRTLSYDSADRITASGWRWDAFGRATDVPAADAGGSGALTAGYYTNDRARQLALDGRTHVYTRDPLDRTKTIDSSGASKPTVTSTYRYSDDSDEPAKVTLSDGSSSREIEGASGQIVATDTSGTITYQLRDLQGSIVAVAPASGTPTASTEYDPFGIVTTSAPNVIDWTKGLPANGWLGTHQRPTDFGQTAVDAAGPIEMGARVYLPKIGRFLQADPIDGGSLNAYDYAFQDPTNMQDLDGLRGGPGTVCLLRNGPIERTKCTRHTIRAVRSIDNSWQVTVFKGVKAAWKRVKIFYDIGKCAFTLFKSRGVDATSCNSFGSG